MMKASHLCLYTVLEKGYETSRLGYREFTENGHISEEFKKDCIVFSKAAEAFRKTDRKGTCAAWFMEKTSKILIESLPIQESKL